MIKEAIPRFDELSSAEKFLLLEELWDNLAGEPSEIPVADWQRQELERRYRDYAQNPSEGSSWSEVRERPQMSHAVIIRRRAEHDMAEAALW